MENQTAMQFDIKEEGESVLITIHGSISLDTVETFGQYFKRILEKNPLPARIGMDMSRVSFIDSTGYGHLIRRLTQCSKQNIALYLFSLNKAVETVFKLSKLDHIFNIIDREQFVDRYFPDEN